MSDLYYTPYLLQDYRKQEDHDRCTIRQACFWYFADNVKYDGTCVLCRNLFFTTHIMSVEMPVYILYNSWTLLMFWVINGHSVDGHSPTDSKIKYRSCKQTTILHWLKNVNLFKRLLVVVGIWYKNNSNFNSYQKKE